MPTDGTPDTNHNTARAGTLVVNTAIMRLMHDMGRGMYNLGFRHAREVLRFHDEGCLTANLRTLSDELDDEWLKHVEAMQAEAVRDSHPLVQRDAEGRWVIVDD